MEQHHLQKVYEDGSLRGRLLGGFMKCFGAIFFVRHPLELFLGLNQSRDLYAHNKKGFRSKDILEKNLEPLEVKNVAKNQVFQ